MMRTFYNLRMAQYSMLTFPLTLLGLLSAAQQSYLDQCRSSSLGIYLPPEEFVSYSCSECFFYIYGVFPVYRMYHFQRCRTGLLVCDLGAFHSDEALLENCHCNNTQLIYNIDNFMIPGNSTTVQSLSTLKLVPELPETYLEITEACCEAAKKCCSSKNTKNIQTVTNVLECPKTWDGWQCFEPTPNATIQKGVCPPYTYASLTAHELRHLKYLYGSDAVFSNKICLPDGSWYKHSNRANTELLEYTDYSTCQTDNPYEHFTRMTVSIVSFALSVVSIIPALIIFIKYPSLRTEVNQIHMHFLISQLLTGIFYIFNTLFFIPIDAPGELLVSSNHISCRILFTFQLRYLRLSNYMWMLCECIFLHRLLNAAFSTHQRLIPFLLIGWVFPLIPTVLYSVAREMMDNEECWINKSRIEWIEWLHLAPGFLSLIINLLLTVGILYIVIRKLQYSPHMEPAQYRKAVRATAMLLPLFGLHFLINIRRTNVFAFQIFSSLLEGLQGLCVVIIICYSNHKVLEMLKHSYTKFRERRQCKNEMVASMHSFRRTTHGDIRQTNEDLRLQEQEEHLKANYNKEALV